jgi:O-antigen/teichoic acid export membrane protein
MPRTPQQPQAASAGTANAHSSSYRQIFKATAVLGGVQVFNVLAGIVRTKVLASLLGPAGMGLIGMYQSATAVVGTIAGMGITQSGVRQIAEAAATGDQARIGRTVRTLRLTSLLAGLLGMLLVLAFREPLAQATFGNDTYALGLGFLSLTLLFGAVAGGQNAVLQGLRRLRDLAANQVAGTVLGTLLSIGLVLWLRERGVVPLLVASAGASVLSSWWYARRVRVTSAALSLSEMWMESRGLFAMGAAFMVSGLLMAGAAYVSRVLIIRQLGIAAVGLYTASWTLSSLYVNTILTAMGADFYPRLTAVAKDNASVNRLVNEQTEMGVLIATPGILVTLTLAPWVLSVFYSSAFVPAAEVIRWQIIGVALRVVSWPMSFIILAKGMPRTYMLTEALAWTLQVLLLAVCLKWWGLPGTGMAFALMYVVVLMGLFAVSRAISGFSWSRRSILLVAFCTFSCALTLMLLLILPAGVNVAVAMAIAIVVSVMCLRALTRILGVGIGALLRSGLLRVR